MLKQMNAEKGGLHLNYWHLYDEILAELPDDVYIDDYAVGIPWTFVRTGEFAGVAMTIRSDTRPRMRDETFVGCSLREAAACIMSWNGHEASIATAAINAWINRPKKVCALRGFHGEDEHAETLADRRKFEAFALYTEQIRSKKVAVVGHFPHFEKEWSPLCELSIIEQLPHDGDYPAEAAEHLIPRQDYVFMTGATFTNKTMPRLLELAQGAVTVIVGPSVPMHPCLFDYGADALSGFTVTDPALAADLVHRSSWKGISPCGKMADVLPQHADT